MDVVRHVSICSGMVPPRLLLNCRHQHEKESGRTSSVGMEILGYSSLSTPILGSQTTGRKLTWEEISEKSSKIISFIDLAGHERYLRTTVFGLTGCAPDYVMLMVGGNHLVAFVPVNAEADDVKSLTRVISQRDFIDIRV